jgi:hypothetical protein
VLLAMFTTTIVVNGCRRAKARHRKGRVHPRPSSVISPMICIALVFAPVMGSRFYFAKTVDINEGRIERITFRF